MINKLKDHISTLATRGGGAAFELIFTLYIASKLGAADTGLYFASLSIVLVLSMASRSGKDLTIVRDLSDSETSEYNNKMMSKYLGGLYTIFCSSLIFIFLSIIVYYQTGATHINSETDFIFPILCPCILTGAIIFYNAEAMKGLYKPNIGQFIYGWMLYPIPLFTIIVFPELNNVFAIALTFAICSVFSMIISTYIVLSELKFDFHTEFNLNPFKGLNFAILLIRPLTLATTWAPIWAIQHFIGAEAAGVFAIASRVSAALLLIPIAIEARAAPIFAQLYSKKNYSDLKNELKKACFTSGVITSAATAILLLGLPVIKSLLGIENLPEFYSILIILLAAYTINGFLAPLGTYSIMTKKDLLALKVTISMLILSIGVSLIGGHMESIHISSSALVAVMLSRGIIYIHSIYNE